MQHRHSLGTHRSSLTGWTLIVLVATLLGCSVAPPSSLEHPYDTVARVIDGDTLEVASGQRVRLLGVDAPETQHSLNAVRTMGQASKEHLAELTLGKKVYLEIPTGNHDPYGRTLAYAYLSDGRLINRTMIEDGFAMPYTKYPCSKTRELLDAAAQARQEHRGLWQDAQFSKAAAYEVRRSTSGVCHTPGNKGFERLKEFTVYQSLEGCLRTGGRLPRRSR